MPLSGPGWVQQFPTSKSTADLVEPFRGDVERFLAALRLAGASVMIADTLRPAQRVYLMHWSYAIAHQNLDPHKAPAFPGVDIEWVHPHAAASRRAAEQMVEAYGIAFPPALSSRHIEGKAIDMTITWQNDLTIADAHGASRRIAGLPHNGAGNTDLHAVGLSFGVHKLLSDAPHWSNDGH
jgi:D-alanyl-D-alanine dipeptidase